MTIPGLADHPQVARIVRGLVAIIAAFACAPSGASAAATLTIATEQGAQSPDVAVDAQGTGHFTWVERLFDPERFVIHYCRVPRGATACQDAQSWQPPGFSASRPHVFAPGGRRVVIEAGRYGGVSAPGCVPPSFDGTVAISSDDDGQTFAPPAVVGSGVTATDEAEFGPGANAVSIINGARFQSMQLNTSTCAVAQLGSADHIYSASVGFVRSGIPIVAFADLASEGLVGVGTTYTRAWSGTGDVNNAASWKPEQALPGLDAPKLASGPRGAFLVGLSSTGVNLRHYDTTTGAFGPPQNVNDGNDAYLRGREIVQDASGNVGVAWTTLAQDFVHYRVTTDGGATWGPLLSLGLAGVRDVQISTAADGGGYAVADSLPIIASVIPPIAQQSSIAVSPGESGQPRPQSPSPPTPLGGPAMFATRTLVTLKLTTARISAQGPVTIRVSNGNRFPVTGSLGAQTTTKIRVSKQRRAKPKALKVKPKAIEVAAGKAQTIKLTLTSALRQQLRQKHQLALRLRASVTDPAGRTRTVTKTIRPTLKPAKKPRKAR